MYEQLYPHTLRATSARWLGSIPCCIALGCADIGEAVLADGAEVYITWGRHLDRVEQERYFRDTSFLPIHIGADDGSAELVLFDEAVAPLLRLLSSDWR